MYKLLNASFAFLLSLQLCAAAQDLEEAHYAAIPERCIADDDPQACLESHGYECQRSGSMRLLMTAYSLGCNAAMSDGRNHFAQLMFDGAEWTLERQRTYTPEPVRERVPSDDPADILLRYLHSLVEDGWSVAGGFDRYESGYLIASDAALYRHDDPWTFVIVCGLLPEQEVADDTSTIVRSECQNRALQVIRDMSQSEPNAPFRAAGGSELSWSESLATLRSGETAVIVEARYQFPQGHVACRLRGGCCSGLGSRFLSSCREPTEAEKAAVDACLALGHRALTPVYNECLIANGVKVGCEPQDDGSRLCY